MKKDNQENKRKATVDRTTFRKRIVAHRMQIFGSVLAVVLAVAVIIVICRISFLNQVYTGYEVINTVERTHVETSEIVSFGNYFLTYSADGIHCTNAEGVDVWSCPYEMQNPMVEVNGNYVAVADYNGRTIYVFNASGELGAIQTTNPIREIRAAANGMVAAVEDGSTVTPVHLYYYDGREIASFRTTMSKSGYPVALGISADSKLVGVSYLYLDNGVLTSKVAFYNFGEVGQNESDNIVSGYDYQNAIVPVLEFMDNSTMFAVANNRLVFYRGTERPVSVADVLLHEEVQAVYHGQDAVGLVYHNVTGETKYKMDLYNEEGQCKTTLYFDMEYDDIIFSGDLIILYNASSAMIFSENGTLKYQGDFEEAVLLMIPTNSPQRYLLVMKDKIQTIVLQ